MPEKKKVCREIVTIGLPLPNLLEYTADVSAETRGCLNALRHRSREQGVETHEVKARSINVASNHANIVEKMIGDWLLVCGSDHTFEPDALCKLLEATEKPPYPKILGAVCNYRGAPYRWTLAVYDDSGERLFPLVPFYNVDPTMMASGSVQYVDVIGSGFTLYHRSVFDTVPTPWWTYEPRRPGMPELEEVLRDWDDKYRFDEWLEEMSGWAEDPGDDPSPIFGRSSIVSAADGIRLKEKAKGLRRLLAKFRRPSSMGFDFHLCLKARDYGIKSYVHWGVINHHLTLEHTHPQRYVHWVESDPKNWMAEVMARNEVTTEKIADMRGIQEKADAARLEWEKAVAEAQKENDDAGDGEGRGEVGGQGRGEDPRDLPVERESVEGTQ